VRNAATNIADVTLELSGKSPIVVFPDADDDRAVRTVSAAIFANSGECYEVGSRLFIQRTSPTTSSTGWSPPRSR
jgi:aldehyde dehydrogenase (NAD+)